MYLRLPVMEYNNRFTEEENTEHAFIVDVILSLSYAHRLATGALHREMPNRTLGNWTW